jgi:hypothetical protein
MLVPVLISAVLFYAFVPGVLVTLPKGASHKTTLLVHAVLFAVTTGLVMHLYRAHFFEFFGNHGASCPVTHKMVDANGNCEPNCPPGGCERGKLYTVSPQVK